MARLTSRTETFRGMFILVTLIGVLQVLNLYRASVSDHPTGVLVTPMLMAERTTYKPPTVPVKQPVKQAEPSELLRRKMSVYRTMQRRNLSATKVFLDLDLLKADSEKYYRQTGTHIPLRDHPDTFFKPNYDPLVYGVDRDNEGYLTFGITTVRRPNTDNVYIYETLDSLIQNVADTDKPFITVVVSLCDTNSTYNQELSMNLYNKYTKHVNSGFLKIIQTPKDIYPDFEKVDKRTYNDPIERVKWRAKQNVDFAYLKLYCRNISRFYIQIEDDVISSRELIRDIQTFVGNRKTPWFMLEVSGLGYIGKLFHSEDLAWVANFLLTFFDKMPCDLLLGSMRAARGQVKPIHSSQGLFQHIGKFSSLGNKLMPSVDERFKDAGKVALSMNYLPAGINPPMTVDTNFIAVKGSDPLDAYNNNITSFYWVISPTSNTYMKLLYKQSFNFTRIIITTGDANTKHDSLKSGALHFSVGKLDSPSGKIKCTKYEFLTNFVGGEVDTKAMGITVPWNIRCLKLSVLHRTRNWVKFRNIIVI